MNQRVVIGDAVLYCGDCLEILPGLPISKSILTDPPYGIGYKHGGSSKNGLKHLNGGNPKSSIDEYVTGDRELFDPHHLLGAAEEIMLWGANHFASRLPDSPAWVVWDKHLQATDWLSFSECEFAWSNITTGKAKIFRHKSQGLIREGEENGQSRVHPTQKPLALMRWCIDQFRISSSYICDPYMGAGTTGVAAIQLGRAFIGIEIERKYFAISCERIEQAQRQAKLFQHDPLPKHEQLELVA